MVGGAIAAFVYWFFIEAHHISEEQSISEIKTASQKVGNQVPATDNDHTENGNELHNMTM